MIPKKKLFVVIVSSVAVTGCAAADRFFIKCFVERTLDRCVVKDSPEFDGGKLLYSLECMELAHREAREKYPDQESLVDEVVAEVEQERDSEANPEILY